MPAAQTRAAVMARRTSRWRPRRIDISLPITLAHVPTSPMVIATTAGAIHGRPASVVAAT